MRGKFARGEKACLALGSPSLPDVLTKYKMYG